MASARSGRSRVFMDGGVVVERGAPREVMANPKHERTKAFLSKDVVALHVAPEPRRPAAPLRRAAQGFRLLSCLYALGFQLAVNDDLQHPAVTWALFGSLSPGAWRARWPICGASGRRTAWCSPKCWFELVLRMFLSCMFQLVLNRFAGAEYSGTE